MVLPSLVRWRAHERRPESLPAPGPYPVARPSWHAIVILVIILVTMGWLLARGYSINAALEAVGGAGALAIALVPCLAGSPLADTPTVVR
jgi:hypothetical protein